MGTYIKKTNEDGKFITDQQATMLYTYNNNIYDSVTNTLNKVEKIFVDRKTGEHKQWGATIYLNAGDDLNTIVSQNIGIGRSWAFYYGKQTNNKGDVLWESVVYIEGELKYKRLTVFDNRKRVIAYCEIDLLTGQKTNKRKCFFGDPAIFAYEFGNEDSANFEFTYRDDDTIKEVFNYDDDYTLDEFLANEEIMAQFPWNQHTYFHSFEPMLPR